MTEQSIISYLSEHFPEKIGDDAAIIHEHQTPFTLISQDLLIEDVHFRRRYHPVDALAHKALHVNLSDIAAMGGKPHSALLSISAHQEDLPYAQQFLENFVQKCHEYHIQLIGGDTTRAPTHHLYLNVTIIGDVFSQHIKKRTDGQHDDLIYVVGNLGFAHIGWTALEHQSPDHQIYKQHFLSPQALVAEGQWLGKQKYIHAMMDISDGLYTDLEKLATASQLQAIIETERLPENITLTCHQLNLNPLQTLLMGGEDYGLLVTLPRDHQKKFETTFKQHFDSQLTLVGYLKKTNITSLPVVLTHNQQVIHFNLEPYFSHF